MERDPAPSLDDLHEQHRRLSEELARVAEYSAEVHDAAAEVHEQLPNPQLAAADLRAHAERDRAIAAEERRRAQES